MPTDSKPSVQPPTLPSRAKITGKQIVEGVTDIVAITVVGGLAWKYPDVLTLALALIAALAGVRVKDVLGSRHDGPGGLSATVVSLGGVLLDLVRRGHG